MIVHLYCRAWNEAHQLDYFFRHYDGLVQHYFIADDASDDGTLEMLAARRDVTLLPKAKVVPESFVLEGQAFSDTSWKQSRGVADWVLIVDMDEHLFHGDLTQYLVAQQAAGVTAIVALGLQMVSRAEPPDAVRLSDWLHLGAPWKMMSKLVAFRPDQIEVTRFGVGRHSAAPQGNVVWPDRDEVLLLHYKYLGIDRTARRHAAAQARRRELDLTWGWGNRYALDAAALEADFVRFERRRVDYRNLADVHAAHTAPRWWRGGAGSPE